MDQEFANRFAASWAKAWNRHDLDAILAHFADHAVFVSPVAARLLPDTRGVLRGRTAIREYWRLGLDRIPDLKFTVTGVYTGIDTLVLNYRNQAGSSVCEVLNFEDGLVIRGEGTYASDDATAASGVRQ